MCFPVSDQKRWLTIFSRWGQVMNCLNTTEPGVRNQKTGTKCYWVGQLTIDVLATLASNCVSVKIKVKSILILFLYSYKESFIRSLACCIEYGGTCLWSQLMGIGDWRINSSRPSSATQWVWGWPQQAGKQNKSAMCRLGVKHWSQW